MITAKKFETMNNFHEINSIKSHVINRKGAKFQQIKLEVMSQYDVFCTDSTCAGIEIHTFYYVHNDLFLTFQKNAFENSSGQTME